MGHIYGTLCHNNQEETKVLVLGDTLCQLHGQMETDMQKGHVQHSCFICSRSKNQVQKLTLFIIMADINAVAKQFIEYYYGVFSQDRGQLAPLYVRIFSICWLGIH